MLLKYDSEIAISIGKSRKETQWKNRDILWSLFVEKLSREHRTAETLAEYMKADKSRQAEIKDIGGFVGGTITGGRRKSGSVASRSLLTLDIDFADTCFWENFTLYYDNAAVVYSTHKHLPKKPRLRLILPFDRPVTPDEYVPIARRIAGTLGINQFDDSTYEAERLMYWPSSPKDGKYYFQYQDGPFINVDEILSSYKNWRDAAEWPVSERQGETIRREIKKQEDPLEKRGIVGAFCRTYGIHKAIETFLSDAYEPCDVDNRYTYKDGSTAAGLIVYDDKFAYSHHGTDPAGGMLCNAFDLVRLHKFGDRDENVIKNGTRADRYPSFIAMEDFCSRDKETRRTLAAEKLQSAGEDFAGIMDDDGDDSWLEDMDTDTKGNYPPTPNNIELILKNDPKLKGCFAYNLFDDRKALLKMPPWRGTSDKEPFIRDDDEARLRIYFSKEPWRIESRQKIADGLETICRDNAFHPVKDYLDDQTWDGVPRLDTLFIDYLGAEDTELNRRLTRLIFTAAAYRVYEPGTKFDQIVVLVGTQGCGKSTILEKMAVKRSWFSSSMPSPDKPEDAAKHLRGKFIIEIGELVGIRKAEVEAIKNFLSKTADDFHAPYGKNDVHRPRQNVFFATTNESQFLRDASGERRYWPIKVAVNPAKYNLWEELTPDVIGQIWAESVTHYKSGLSLKLSEELSGALEAIQEEYKEVDEWQGLIEVFLDRKLPANWASLGQDQRKSYFLTDDDQTYAPGTILREKVCVAEILNECPNLGVGATADRRVSLRISRIMDNISGWGKAGKTVKFGLYGTQKGWFRSDKKVTGETIF